MSSDADNPYAAPQAPPEKATPVPWSVYLRTGLAGIMAFVIAFSLAAGFSTIAWLAATAWIGPPIVEREEMASTGY